MIREVDLEARLRQMLTEAGLTLVSLRWRSSKGCGLVTFGYVRTGKSRNRGQAQALKALRAMGCRDQHSVEAAASALVGHDPRLSRRLGTPGRFVDRDELTEAEAVALDELLGGRVR